MFTLMSYGIREPIFIIQMYVFSVCTSMWSKMIYCVVPLQIPHAHSGVSGRGMNFGAGPAFSSSMNIGGNIQGLSSGLGSGGNRNSVHGMPVSSSIGNSGQRISSVGNMVSASNIGRNIGTGGLSVPSIASRINLNGSGGSGSLNVQGSSRMMNGLLHQQGN
jgi:CCR4-NOT transcription complex subunit 2